MNELLNINWEDFHFIRPFFLWLILPAFAILVIGILSVREEVKWKKVIAPHLRPYVIQKGSEGLKKRMQVLTFIFLLIAIVGLSGPTWNTVEVPGKTLETPVVLVLDLSHSMMAEDIQPNRLDRAKFKIIDLLDANPRARIALVGFSGTAHTIVPLTHDYKIIKSHIEGLYPGIMPLAGSNLQAALEVTDTILNVTTAPGTVILLTDDITENSFNILSGFANNGESIIEILPINTHSGATIPDEEGNSQKKNEGDKEMHSALNMEILEKLNSLEKVEVHNLTLDKSDVQFLAKRIAENLEFKEKDEEKEDDWEDRGLLLIIPLAVFLLLWFRRGWVIYFLVIMLTLSSCDTNSTFINLWISKDYQAQKLFDRGEYEHSAKLFTNPLRKGISHYKAGNYEEAIKYFSEDTTALGAYNLGLAYFKKGDLISADIAFAKAAEINPELTDAISNQKIIREIIREINEANPEQVEELASAEEAGNVQNKDPEDLGGGGQEATKEDLERERKEETITTDVRKGKELDEVPDEFESGEQDNSQKILMRKVDDDPSLFLKRKFEYQVKQKNDSKSK